MPVMKRVAFYLALVLSGTVAFSQEPKPSKAEASALVIESENLGDAESGVVVKLSIRPTIPEGIPADAPLLVQGSFLQEGKVLRNFRWTVRPVDRAGFHVFQTLPAGTIEIEARLMLAPDEATPVMIGKTVTKFNVAATGQPYVASEEAAADAILAEGVVPESSGALRILPPRRDLAPHLFLVDVDVKAPVKRVEFYVEGKKVFTKNAPPYRTELDLGALPRRVEVRVIGYDAQGRYVDADAWIVNERDNPLEVKITRTVTRDDVSHIKVSVQNPGKNALQSVVLFAGDRKLYEWKRPPYAFDIASSLLAGHEFIRASATDSTGYEASDLLYLDGNRYFEEVEVNMVELPISVMSATGAAIMDLKQEDFQIFEDKKPKKISSFAFSKDLPLSVGVLVDHSGSMKDRIVDARSAAMEFFRQILGPRDRAFLGGFSWSATGNVFVSDVGMLQSQIETLPEAEGGTALYDAIITGLYRFRTRPGRTALIIVSDGEDTVSRVAYDDMLQYVRAARVPLYFIGVGMSAIDFGVTGKIKGLAAETGGVAYFVKNTEDLKKIYEQLEKELRTQYLIGYYTESSRTDRNYRTVEVRTSRKEAKVRTVRGFIP